MIKINKIFGIYGIQNIANNKIYVGSAVDFLKRSATHKSKLKNNNHANSHLQNSWNKYGEQNFKFILLELVNDKKKLITRETYWMNCYKASNRKFGYNIRRICSSNLGLKVSEKTKIKMSLAGSSRRHTEKTKAKLSQDRMGNKNPMYGKTLTQEHKNKLSKANKGKIITKKMREKISKANKGRISVNKGKKNIHSLEGLKKMSMSSKNNTYRLGATHTKKSIEKMSKAKMGHSVSEETKLKISKSLKVYFNKKKITIKEK